MRGWTGAWNAVIREVIFNDHELKKLMKVPPKTGIIQFTERYFIRAGFTSKLLTDEVCRIVYADVSGSDTRVPNVKKNMMTFDIYVKQDEQRGNWDDGLLLRSDLIADRLYHLLTKDRYVAETGYRFWPAGDWDLGTRTAGYTRKTFALYYMKTY